MAHNRGVRGTDPHLSHLMKSIVFLTCLICFTGAGYAAMTQAGLIDLTQFEARTAELQERCGETNPISARNLARYGHCD